MASISNSILWILWQIKNAFKFKNFLKEKMTTFKSPLNHFNKLKKNRMSKHLPYPHIISIISHSTFGKHLMFWNITYKMLSDQCLQALLCKGSCNSYEQNRFVLHRSSRARAGILQGREICPARAQHQNKSLAQILNPECTTNYIHLWRYCTFCSDKTNSEGLEP